MSNRIEAANITLMLAQFGDVNDVLRGVRDSIKELSVYLAWAVQEYNLKHAQSFIQYAVTNNQAGKDTTYIIRTKMGSFIGVITLKHKPDNMGQTVPAFNIGYWITTPQTGKGYASEAVQALANHALVHLKAARVQVSCNSINLASAKVAEKAGFKLEARLKNTNKNADGTLADTLIFAKLG